MSAHSKKYSHGSNVGNDPTHIERGHLTDHAEYRDLSFKAINQFMIGLAGIVVLSYFAMWGMYAVFESEHAKNDPAPSPVAQTTWPNVKPDVQSAPHVELVTLQRYQDSVLAGQKAGAISIEDAMQEVLAEGLPYRKGGPVAAAESETTGDDTATGDAAASKTDAQESTEATSTDGN